MKTEPNIYAIIPARGGSKGVPRKNIKIFSGYPLIAYAIAAAKLSKKNARTIVSTDDSEIAKIAQYFGAEVPFLRPKKYAGDKSKDIEFVRHALSWFQENEGLVPDYLVHLRPTTPLRNPKDIDAAIDLLSKNRKATSLRSGYELRESPYKLFKLEKKYFEGLFPTEKRAEYHSLPRQSFPPAYQPDGYVDILVTKEILKTELLYGPKILAYISPNTGEIDTLQDFKYLEYKLKEKKWDVFDYLKNTFPRYKEDQPGQAKIRKVFAIPAR